MAMELPHCENVAFTADEWQSRAENLYMWLSILYIKRKFQMRKFTITFKSTEDRQSEAAKSALIALMISNINCLRPKDRCARTMVHDIGMNKKAR